MKTRLTSLYKSEPFTVIEKKGNTLKRCLWKRACSKCSRWALFLERVWFLAQGVKAHRLETRLATISSTEWVLASRKNQDKISIKNFGDHVLSWTFINLPLRWNIWQLRLILTSANIKVMLQNLGYQRFVLENILCFKRLVLLKRGWCCDRVHHLFVSIVYYFSLFILIVI